MYIVIASLEKLLDGSLLAYEVQIQGCLTSMTLHTMETNDDKQQRQL